MCTLTPTHILARTPSGAKICDVCVLCGSHTTRSGRMTLSTLSAFVVPAVKAYGKGSKSSNPRHQCASRWCDCFMKHSLTSFLPGTPLPTNGPRTKRFPCQTDNFSFPSTQWDELLIIRRNSLSHKSPAATRWGWFEWAYESVINFVRSSLWWAICIQGGKKSLFWLW